MRIEDTLAIATPGSPATGRVDNMGAWLGVHLERPPAGEWMAMDARTRLGDAGAGLCTSVLSDERGRVGVTTQTLLVTRRR
jgi:hypothetical protein